MKRVLSLLFISSLFLSLPQAQASSLITLTEPPHKSADGIFLNNQLAESVSPSGRLGKLVFDRPTGAKTWVIDVSLVEDVIDLADGYTYLDEDRNEVVVDQFVVADIWINTLKAAVKRSTVLVLPYGNPSLSFLNRAAPGELSVYRTLSQQRLAAILGVEVGLADSSSASGKKPAASTQQLYTTLRKSIRTVNTLVTTPDVETLRLRIAQLLNTDVTKEEMPLLTKSYRKAEEDLRKRLRISAGNYTITSAQYDLPVTLVNDFNQPVTVDIDIWSTNARIIIGTVSRQTIDANSQLQVKVPIDVIASGETSLNLQLKTPAGKSIGDVTTIPLRLAVISPLTTWFTTGMAIILLLAAIIQSVRRVKRRKGK